MQYQTETKLKFNLLRQKLTLSCFICVERRLDQTKHIILLRYIDSRKQISCRLNRPLWRSCSFWEECAWDTVPHRNC